MINMRMLHSVSAPHIGYRRPILSVTKVYMIMVASATALSLDELSSCKSRKGAHLTIRLAVNGLDSPAMAKKSGEVGR